MRNELHFLQKWPKQRAPFLHKAFRSKIVKNNGEGEYNFGLEFSKVEVRVGGIFFKEGGWIFRLRV